MKIGWCSENQIKLEVGKCLDMLSEVYEVFGLSYSAVLSTRPESRMGDDAQWDKAEQALTDALNAHQEKTGQAWGVSSLPTTVQSCLAFSHHSENEAK